MSTSAQKRCRGGVCERSWHRRGGAALVAGLALWAATGCELIAGIEERTFDPGANAGGTGTTTGVGGQGATSTGGTGGGGNACAPADPPTCGPTNPAPGEERWPDSSSFCFGAQPTCMVGEDGYFVGAHSYVDNAASGSVTDQVTGLEWQNRDLLLDSTYAAVGSFCADLSLGGPGTWRFPTFLEMLSLMDYGRETFLPAEIVAGGTVPGHWVVEFGGFDNLGFGTPWYYYFMHGSSEDGGAVFQGGEATWGGGDILRSVRCVRGNLSTETPVVVGECGNSGLVRDPRTGLEWQLVPSENSELSWQQAMDHCSALCDNGGGWRLASVKQLGTIFVADEHRGVLPDAFGPVGTGLGAVFWTSTPSRADLSKVFVIDFGTNDAYYFPLRSTDPNGLPHRAWCVRPYDPTVR